MILISEININIHLFPFFFFNQRWTAIKNPAHLPAYLPPPHLPLHLLPKIRMTQLKQVLLIIYYPFFFILFILCIILQKEVFIWVDSELKDVYEINNKIT